MLREPFMLQGTSVTAVVFYVRDLERTRKFYHEMLGLNIHLTTGNGQEQYHRFMTADVGDVSLIFFEGEHEIGRSPIVVFGVKRGIEEIVDNLVRNGVEIVLPVSEAPGGLTADFLDPDGHILSLYQSLRQDGGETEAKAEAEAGGEQ